MTIVLIIVGLILALAALAGCVFPVIPGPALSYVALLIVAWAKDWTPFSTTFLIIMFVLVVVVSVLDYVVGILGAKKFGASKYGVIGSIVGTLAGIFFFPPFGMLAGAIVGALAGELLAGKKGSAALKAGWGVIVGNLIGAGLKLAYCAVGLLFCIKALF